MSKERIGDKEDDISDLVKARLGLTILCYYITAIYYYIMAIYRYLLFLLAP